MIINYSNDKIIIFIIIDTPVVPPTPHYDDKMNKETHSEYVHYLWMN